MDERRAWIRRLADREIFELIEDQTDLKPGQLVRARKMRQAIRHTCKAVVEIAESDAPAGVDPARPLRARVLDLSSGGASLFTKYELREGTRLKLGVVLHNGQVIESQTQVRWSTPKPAKEGFAVGLEFVDIDAKNEQRLSTFLTELATTLGM